MATTTATVHKTNVMNLDKFVIEVTTFGATYNPSKTSIKLDALNAFNTKVKAVDDAETKSLLTVNNARNARADSFAKSTDVITRVANSIRASDISDSTQDDLLSITDKFLGRTRGAKKETTTTTPAGTTINTLTSHSTAPADVDSKLTYLDALIKQLTTITAYNPNEANLKVAALTTLYTDMKTKRTAEITAEAAHSTTVEARNEVMYPDNTGIISVTNDVKAYVKSIYGASSPQYKRLTALKFTKPKL